MKTGTQQVPHGKLLLVSLGLLLSSCRTDAPPKLSIICIGDGFGGADCTDSTGNKVYKSPTDLLNFWMTTQVDEANYTSWCYGTTASVVKPFMDEIYREAKK